MLTCGQAASVLLDATRLDFEDHMKHYGPALAHSFFSTQGTEWNILNYKDHQVCRIVYPIKFISLK